MSLSFSRRKLLRYAAVGAAGVTLSSCSEDPGPRYTDADIEVLAAQWRNEGARSGQGPYGELRFRGYRGLAQLPWFELDDSGNLQNVATDLPKAIDVHCHFGRSTFFAPELDLHRSSPRVQHLLDCDKTDPGCELDLDVYINRNFDDEALAELRWGVASSMLWGSTTEATHTIPNLLAEMDATGVEQAVILPIAFGLPFGDDLTERWMQAIVQSGNSDRFIQAASVHPRDSNRIEKLRRFSAAGARVVKLHPTMQHFYPDGDDMTEYYRECERLKLVLFFHCGRAGIEPESMHRYALPRHFDAAIRAFPKLQFVLGHSGARDVAQAIPLVERYDNVWLGASCQGVTMLNEMLERTGGERMLYGTDWPFYHLAVSLAKLLIVTEDKPDARYAVLRGNALQLFGNHKSV